VWGPVAGWLNKTVYSGKYDIQSVDGDALSWPVAIGFAKGSTELRDQVDAALPKLEAMLPTLVEKYGLPTDAPVKLTALAQPLVRLASMDAPTKPQVVADATTAPAPVAATPAPLTPDVIKSRENDSEAVTSGRETFNGTCAHCHGPDAVQSERHIDLRRLHKKYGDDMRATYWKTVHEGRPAKGMPAWKDVFDDKQLNEIYAYLLTVQAPAN
jgi:mono/diheme cytochrome c family protein